jgi:peptidyl-prolyl cis-trans isomerase SurA
MTMKPLVIAASLVICLAFALPAAVPVMAAGQGVVAVVNDLPITEHDITQRIALMKTLGDVPQGGISRKRALQSLVDEQVKISEATKLRMMPKDKEVRAQIERMAEGMKTSADGLTARLEKQGISKATFERYVSALIGFNRILSGKYRNDVQVSDSEVDRKFAEIKSKANGQMAKIMNDPRMKAITVYSLMEISLPVEGEDSMLLQARAVEAAQVKSRLKGCGNVRAASKGVFNVKIGKRFDADASKLPKQMRAALDKAGAGNAVGPMRGKDGIQLVAFCGSRKLTPPKPKFTMPTRDQVRRALVNEKYDGLEEEYLKSVRGSIYVEYRNSNYAQQ